MRGWGGKESVKDTKRRKRKGHRVQTLPAKRFVLEEERGR